MDIDHIELHRRLQGTWLLPEYPNHQISLKHRYTGVTGSSSSSLGSLSSSFRPPLPKSKTEPLVSKQGPFLLLTVSDLPKAIANVKVFGMPVDFANWLTSFDEVRGGRFARIVNTEDHDRSIEVSWDGTVEIWRRVQRR